MRVDRKPVTVGVLETLSEFLSALGELLTQWPSVIVMPLGNLQITFQPTYCVLLLATSKVILDF